MTDLIQLSASELSAAYAAGELSPVEATRAVLERAHAVDDRINAFTTLLDDAALEQAGRAEQRWRAGAPLSRIDGVPTSIKDNVPMAALPCRKGSATTDAGPAPENGPAVDRLLEAGAVLFGRTTLPDNACKGVTDSPLTGITRNPWDLERTPGGSSGGAAAALAAWAGPLALGSDGAGSIRIPCAFSGLAGIKQTYGRVAALPGSPFEGMSHQGPMARSVGDVGLLLTAIAHPDPRDGSSWPGPAVYDPTADVDGLEGVRVAFTPDFGLSTPIEPGVSRSIAAAADVLRSLGADVVEDCPDLSGVESALSVLWHGGLAKVYQSVPQDRRELFDPALVEMARRGEGLSAAQLVAASTFKAELGSAMGRFHQRYDLLVGPTLPLVAFEAGVLAPPAYAAEDWMSWSPYVAAFNMTQQPAASIPCGLSDGLPVGLQIVGRRNEDALVLRAAEAFERAAGGFAALSDNGKRLAV